MSDDRLKAATVVASKHYAVESGMEEIVLYSADHGVERVEREPLKLLEVNANTISSGVMPLHFGPAPEFGFDYPSVIIEVTPEEYDQIRSHRLRLPAGWDIPFPLPKSSLHTEAI